MRRCRGLAWQLLRLYPTRWRDRYELEVRTVLEDHPVRLITLVDLIVGAVDARLDPVYRSEEGFMSGSEPQGRRKYTRCSFCGKGQDQVRKLVAGPGVFICDGCIELCNEVLAMEDGPHDQPPADTRQTAHREARVRPRSWLRNIFRSTVPRSTLPREAPVA